MSHLCPTVWDTCFMKLFVGERTVISGPVFKVHCGRREECSERSQLARSSVQPQSSVDVCHTTPYAMLTHHWYRFSPLTTSSCSPLSRMLTKQLFFFFTPSQIKCLGEKCIILAFVGVSRDTNHSTHAELVWTKLGKNKNDKWASEIVDWRLLARHESMMSSAHRLSQTAVPKVRYPR